MAKKDQQTLQTLQNSSHQNAAPVQNMEFDAWWAQVSSKYDFGESLKQAVKLHVKARGFWDSKEWNKGLRDFGYNV
jgi:hypothetical protein